MARLPPIQKVNLLRYCPPRIHTSPMSSFLKFIDQRSAECCPLTRKRKLARTTENLPNLRLLLYELLDVNTDFAARLVRRRLTLPMRFWHSLLFRMTTSTSCDRRCSSPPTNVVDSPITTLENLYRRHAPVLRHCQTTQTLTALPPTGLTTWNKVTALYTLSRLCMHLLEADQMLPTQQSLHVVSRYLSGLSCCVLVRVLSLQRLLHKHR